MITWYGGKRGHRFGPKQFATLLPTSTSPRDLLGQVARALHRVTCPVSAGRPWRAVPDPVPASVRPDALAFSADGRYSWSTAAPRLQVDPAGAVTLTAPLPHAPRGGGQGCVYLECTAIPSRRKPRAGLILEFTEGSLPMWLRRESETLVACTVLQLARALGDKFRVPVEWHFRLGDWTNIGQPVQVPGHGVYVLTSGR
jgi:hypothetical protein